MRFKTPEQLSAQVQETGFSFSEQDLEKSAEELRQQYGAVYDEYVEQLRKLRTNIQEQSDVSHETIKQGDEVLAEHGMTRAEFITLLFFSSSSLAAGGAVWEWLAKTVHEKKMSVGKNNPILAAQSDGGMVFKTDFGDPGTRTGSVEQVLLYPSADDEDIERQKGELEKLFKTGKVPTDEFASRIKKLESGKKQGFISTEKRELVTFEELADHIRERGECGILTTLHFGDSSTSGWNSDALAENVITAAELLYPTIRRSHPELPETFRDYCLAEDPEGYRSRNTRLTAATVAEKLKGFPEYQTTMADHWGEIRKQIRSPFQSYDTYSDKGAKIEADGSHSVNLGVPGYTSVHLKSYVMRMLDKLEVAGVLRFVDSATLYIGNNDGINNGNKEDKYYVGEDTKKQLHGVGYLKETFPKLFLASRVAEDDFRKNIEEIVQLLKGKGIAKVVLTVPVTPLDWRPGLRAASDAQSVVERIYAQQGRASGMLDEAREVYADYLYVAEQADGKQSAQAGQIALESDVMVPRIKSRYVKILSEVAAKHKTGLVNLAAVLPARDMSHQNTSARNPNNVAIDYCHPSEHANTLIAFAHALAKGSVETSDIRARAKAELLKLGISDSVADYELSVVEEGCVAKIDAKPETYQRLSSVMRTRKTWNDT